MKDLFVLVIGMECLDLHTEMRGRKHLQYILWVGMRKERGGEGISWIDSVLWILIAEGC